MSVKSESIASWLPLEGTFSGPLSINLAIRMANVVLLDWFGGIRKVSVYPFGQRGGDFGFELRTHPVDRNIASQCL